MTGQNLPRTMAFGPEAIAEAARLIAAGQPVAIPTETVYGLAADATDAAAVARIYEAKGRPSFNPLIVHVLDLAAALRLAAFDADALALAGAFWPGPLTLVLPLRPDSGIASLVTAGLPIVAIRVPAHRAMRSILEATGKPLAAPSANASGGISPTRASHVVASLGMRVSLVIDDGGCEAGLESTIVRGREILRPGPITGDEITALFSGECRSSALDSAALATLDSGLRRRTEIVAPGQLDSHYAPQKPLRLSATHKAGDEYLIGFGTVTGDTTLSFTSDLTEAAATLFDALHRADASDRDRIAVAWIPETGIGAAINDRLRRAAHRD